MKNEILHGLNKTIYVTEEVFDILANEKEAPFIFEEDKKALEELAKNDRYLRGVLNYGMQ